ncbi:MAG: 3-deoxy-manno-octulosonate cytidylyltransferase [Rhodospirillales bacterium]|nr:3-deoxy-manno-octulosonate cytidylyltransferase [Rhodospirillales bacterium]
MTPSSHPNSLHPIVVIPSRLAATRLPRKPLADIHGRPMIMHVWQRAVEADLGPVVVAAADREIADAVTAAGGHAVLTRPELASGSDRVFEAVEMIDPERRHDVVVNLQGDLPTLDPKAVRAVLRPLIDTSVDIATLVAPIADPRERDDENVVKAAVAFAGADTIGPALYFSRSPIPWGTGPTYHHIGLYAFRRTSLARFVRLAPGVLEQRERLEQLRALENGMRIAAALVDTIPIGVDTPTDLDRARDLLSPAQR